MVGGGGIFWGEGITWFLREQKGGSVVTEDSKGVITENFGRIQSGDHSNLLGKWRHGGGGDREIHQKLLGGGAIQWSNIQRGIGWISPCLAPNPPGLTGGIIIYLWYRDKRWDLLCSLYNTATCTAMSPQIWPNSQNIRLDIREISNRVYNKWQAWVPC